MYCIIPLAGPDCYDPSYGVRCLQDLDGTPLIQRVVTSRYWYKSEELKNSDYIFVLREGEYLEELRNFLKSAFPGCRFVVLSRMTKGALLSSAAALSLIDDFDQPIMVDLADIDYQANFSPTTVFSQNPDIIGILPYFYSSEEKYSYLRMEQDFVLETAEKKVISNKASAGTYCFRNFSAFCKAIDGSVLNRKKLSHREALFLCPSYNCLVTIGKVLGIEVNAVQTFASRSE